MKNRLLALIFFFNITSLRAEKTAEPIPKQDDEIITEIEKNKDAKDKTVIELHVQNNVDIDSLSKQIAEQVHKQIKHKQQVNAQIQYHNDRSTKNLLALIILLLL